jgi:hypothetical protein
MLRLCIVFCCLFAFLPPVYASELSFRELNPDAGKYAFVKDYIFALSYYARVAQRLQLEGETAAASLEQQAVVRQLIANRTLDNTELRIARNYLKRYCSSASPFVRKTALTAVDAYQRLLTMSARERTLWSGFLRYITDGQPENFDEKEFSRQQVLLAQQKKEVAKDVLRASVLATRVMLSSAHCEDETCRVLDFTPAERDRLSAALATVPGINMDWGMKPGQSTVEASAAVIRESLEDPLYLSRP